MVSNKFIAVLAASSALALFAATSANLALFAATSANAESIVKEEQQQLGNSTAPDVDPGASRGPNKSIVTQERMQLGNSPGPNVPERSMKGGESIPDLEKKDIPH
jgi:hypothetical protein